jgi:hypothetical protein
VAIGTLVWVLFVLYVTTLGHEAVRRGSTGLLGEHDRPAVGAHRHTAATAASVDAPAAVTA